MRFLLLAMFVVSIGCSDSNPIVSAPDVVQARVVATEQNARIALLEMQQGFNDLGRWIVTGKIKNISQVSISGISVQATLYEQDGSLIHSLDERPSHGGYGDLPPQGETTFDITFYEFLHLDRKTPDASRTVIDILVDGYKVSYDDRAGLPPHKLFDFRFSNWDDDEDTVASNEPAKFELEHRAGGKGTKVSVGKARTLMRFPGIVYYTVDVEYRFRGGLLQSGTYTFTQIGPSFETVEELLDERYGTSVTLENFPGVLAWVKNADTYVYLHPATEESEIEILYLKIGSTYNTDEENDYNRLPIRVVVGE